MKTFADLFAKKPNKIKLGLDRMQRGLRALGLERATAPTFLIGGTNGKGTTAGFLWHLCTAAGMRAGLYTSPHLVHFHERFQLSDGTITDRELAERLQALQTDLGRTLYDELSFFEVSTLLALQLFQERQTECNVLEVGLGGRLDATNAQDPIASAVVSVGLDHQQWLGETLGQIAHEKFAIGRHGAPLFFGTARSPADVEAELLEYGTQHGGPIFRSEREFFRCGNDVILQIPQLARQTFALPAWVSEHPAECVKGNFALACAMFYWFVKDGAVLHTAVKNFGRSDLAWPYSFAARSQILTVNAAQGEYEFLLDVCHNPAAMNEFMRVLCTRFPDPKKRPPALLTFLADKDVNGMLDLLRGVLKTIVLFRLGDERSFGVDDLAERHRDIVVHDNFAAGWQSAKTEWKGIQGPWVVCGSLLGVGEVLRYFDTKIPNRIGGALVGTDPSALRAFPAQFF